MTNFTLIIIVVLATAFVCGTVVQDFATPGAAQRRRDE